MKNYKVILSSALLGIFLSGPAFADQGGLGKGKAKGIGHGVGHSMNQGKAVSKGVAKSLGVSKVQFTNSSRDVITKYFNATPFPTSTLPPGIAMNLARGKPLPPGIQKVFLPSGLTDLLPVYPGYQYLQVGDDVVLVNSTTGIVADILSNVLR